MSMKKDKIFSLTLCIVLIILATLVITNTKKPVHIKEIYLKDIQEFKIKKDHLEQVEELIKQNEEILRRLEEIEMKNMAGEKDEKRLSKLLPRTLRAC